jgi:hypothetical protein
MLKREEILPRLYGETSTGQSLVWYVYIFTNMSEGSEESYYEIIYGREEYERSIARSRIFESKNEFSSLQQCITEIRKKWMNKQRNHGFMVRNSFIENTGIDCAVMSAVIASNLS